MYTKCFSTLICCEWVYGSTLTLLCLCRSEVVDVLMIGVGLSLCDVVMSWLRLQTPVDCIPNPFGMYAKCFGILICFGWAYVCAPLHWFLCKWGLWCHGWGRSLVASCRPHPCCHRQLLNPFLADCCVASCWTAVGVYMQAMITRLVGWKRKLVSVAISCWSGKQEYVFRKTLFCFLRKRKHFSVSIYGTVR
jgi:hypothetical protein